MNTNKKLIALFSLLACSQLVASSVLARELAGVKLPEGKKIAGTHLLLNGAGLRTATFFAIKVYAAALYVKERSQNPEKLLAADSPKHLELHFLRSVSADKLRAAWRDGFANNGVPVDGFASRIEKLCAMMKDVDEKSTLAFTAEKEVLSVFADNQLQGSIEGKAFIRAFLLIWLGPKPPNAALKSGLLGISN